MGVSSQGFELRISFVGAGGLRMASSTHGSLTDSDYQDLSHDIGYLRLEVQSLSDRLRACEREQTLQGFSIEQQGHRLNTIERFLHRLRQCLQSVFSLCPPIQAPPTVP